MVVTQNLHDCAAADTAESAYPHRNVAASQTFRNDKALCCHFRLLFPLGCGTVQQNIHCQSIQLAI